jgi:hypothetical protein
VVLDSLQLPFIEDASATVCVLDGSTDRFTSPAGCIGRIALAVVRRPEDDDGGRRALGSLRYGEESRITSTATTGAAR